MSDWEIKPAMMLRAIQNHDEMLFIVGHVHESERWVCQTDDEMMAVYEDEVLRRHFEPAPGLKPPLPELKSPMLYVNPYGHLHGSLDYGPVVAKLTIRVADDGQSYEIETEDLR